MNVSIAPTIALTVRSALKLAASIFAAGAIAGVLASHAHAQSFGADFGGSDLPGWTDRTYSTIPWPHVAWDDQPGSFASSGWTPVPVGQKSHTVLINGQVWISALADSPSANTQFVVKVFKNGINIPTGIGTEGSIPGTAVIQWHVIDRAQPGDVYTVQLWPSSSSVSGVTVNGNPYHTFIQGVVIPWANTCPKC